MLPPPRKQGNTTANQPIRKWSASRNETQPQTNPKAEHINKHTKPDRRATTDQSQRDIQTEGQTDETDQRATRETQSIVYKVRSRSEGNHTYKHADERSKTKNHTKIRPTDKEQTSDKTEITATRTRDEYDIYVCMCVVKYSKCVVYGGVLPLYTVGQ